MTPIQKLSELKSIELSIMKKVHEFCEYNHLWYVLTYGTLLGAIRHNGFIPWDDDIDIHMMRDDYDKFIRLFPDWGRDNNLQLVHSHTEGNEFPRDVIKVIDTRTFLVERDYKNKCKMGVYIDIWPLDKAPVKLSVKDGIWLKTIEVLKRLSLASDILTTTNTFEKLSNRKKLFIVLFGHFNSKKLVLIQEKLSRKNNSINEARYISFQANRRFYELNDLIPAQLHKFEDTEFFIPHNYHAILRLTYGDYMSLPPENEQIPHHIQDVFWR